MVKRIGLVLLVTFASGCVTQKVSTVPDGSNNPRNETELPPEETPPARPTERRAHIPVNINMAQLQNELGLTRAPRDLGFEEKSFDGCRFNLRDSDGQCGPLYLVVLNFRLQCRDSIETVQDVAVNFQPLSDRNVEWRLGGTAGRLNTDAQGFGQMSALFATSVKAQRFMLILGVKSLGLEASEVSQIVIPGNWCVGL